jgi:hypothetical protein
MSFGAVVVCGGISYSHVSSNAEAAKKVEMVERDLEIVKTQAKAEIEIIKAEAKKEVAAAERRVAEKFLMYGYAAEYARYQELDRIKKEEVEKP